MDTNDRKHPIRRALRALCLALLALLIYHIVGGYQPFATRPVLEDVAAIEARADEMQRDAQTSDRAMLLGTHVDALDERIRLIGMAQEDVVIASYDLRDGESTRDVLCVALERADAGVRVRLLVDGISGRLRLSGSALFRALEAHPNIEIRFYNPPRLLSPEHDMGRMHDKYVIVDDLAFILGGRNMFDSFIGDYPVDLRKDDREALIYNGAHGTPAGADSAVARLRDYFEGVWESDACTGFIGRKISQSRASDALDDLRERLGGLRAEKPALFGDVDYPDRTMPTKGVWLISNPTCVTAKQPVVFSTLCALMERAEDEVIIHSPYAVLSDDMRDRLAAIAARTPTTLMVNAVELSHNIVATGDYLYHKKDVLAIGATLLEYAGDNYHHGKAVLIDDDLSVIGCYNLDLRSTYVDTELMLVVRGEAFNAALRENMEALHAACRRVIDADHAEVPIGLKIPPLSFFKRLALAVAGAVMQPVRNLV